MRREKLNQRPSRQFLEIAAELSTVCAVTPQVIDWVSWEYVQTYRREDLGIYVSLRENDTEISIHFCSISAGTYAAAKVLVEQVINLARGKVQFFVLGVPVTTVDEAWEVYLEYTYVEGIDLNRIAPNDGSPVTFY